MEQAAVRTLTSQMAEDLAWLEQHARSQPQQAAKAGELRYAAALVRNAIAPFLEGHGPMPLHVAVVGGAGAGKSTVANMLCGAVLAESNPQAGFTRHPVAYATGASQIPWPSASASSARLTRQVRSVARRRRYQVRRASPVPGSLACSTSSSSDCPDADDLGRDQLRAALLEVRHSRTSSFCRVGQR